jgi:hypothetical protein
MADRDWDKELAKIDKQLNSLPDDKLAPSALTAGARPAAGVGGKAAVREPARVASGEPRGTTSLGVYARLTISVLLGLAMVFWPYPARCGPGLAAYLAAVVAVISSGMWSAVWTWRHRASRAHTLSLLLILWGLVLGSIEVLPRVGYAKPDLQHPTTWVCPS